MSAQKTLIKWILSALVSLLLAGCAEGLGSQTPHLISASQGVPAISQAELEEIIAGISQKYGLPAMAAALVTDQGLQQAAARG